MNNFPKEVEMIDNSLLFPLKVHFCCIFVAFLCILVHYEVYFIIGDFAFLSNLKGMIICNFVRLLLVYNQILGFRIILLFLDWRVLGSISIVGDTNNCSFRFAFPSFVQPLLTVS